MLQYITTFDIAFIFITFNESGNSGLTVFPKTKTLFSSGVTYKLDLPGSVTCAVRLYLPARSRGASTKRPSHTVTSGLPPVSAFQQWLWGEQDRCKPPSVSWKSAFLPLLPILPQIWEDGPPNTRPRPREMFTGPMNGFPNGKTLKREYMQIAGSHKNRFISSRWLLINVYSWSCRFASYTEPQLLGKEHATILP